MKLMKRIFLALWIVIIVLYAGIVVANNFLADRIEKDLAAYQLPSGTQLVDSVSLAGKLTGNGNGMQYMGAILVESELEEDALQEYYGAAFDYIEVRKQDTADISFVHKDNVSFGSFPEANKVCCYSITCWDSGRREIFGDFLSNLLDLDIRGH